MSRITLHSKTFLCHIEACKPEIYQLSLLKGRYLTDNPINWTSTYARGNFWTVMPKHSTSSKFSVGLHSPFLPSTICTIHIWDATNILTSLQLSISKHSTTNTSKASSGGRFSVKLFHQPTTWLHNPCAINSKVPLSIMRHRRSTRTTARRSSLF